MHGGARGTGAPKGNRNAVKHGFFTSAAKAERHELEDFLRQSDEHLASFEKDE